MTQPTIHSATIYSGDGIIASHDPRTGTLDIAFDVEGTYLPAAHITRDGQLPIAFTGFTHNNALTALLGPELCTMQTQGFNAKALGVTGEISSIKLKHTLKFSVRWDGKSPNVTDPFISLIEVARPHDLLHRIPGHKPPTPAQISSACIIVGRSVARSALRSASTAA